MNNNFDEFGSGMYGNNPYSQNGQNNGQNVYQNASNNSAYGTGNGAFNPYSNDQKKPKKQKKTSTAFRKFTTTIAIALVFGLVAGLMFQGTSYISGKILGKDAAKNSSSVTTASNNDDESESKVKTLTKSSGKIDATKTSTATTVNDVSDIVDNVMPSIVQVTNATLTEYNSFFYGTYTRPEVSAGSGIIIAEDGDYIYIVTNNHVIASDSTAQKITITFSDESAVEGVVQGADESNDLAVVKVKMSDLSDSTLSTIKVATIGDSTKVNVGDSAVVIGNAMGYGQSVTTGVISALNREVSLQTEDGQTISNKLMQTDAAVNPGNSGGALLNMNGEVIGIVSAKYIDTEAEGLGYAIPISNAESIIEDLMNGKSNNTAQESGDEIPSFDSAQTAFLGIAGYDISINSASTYNIPEGVYVIQVNSGSGAEKAGIEQKDIITAIDGNTVTSMEELSKYLENFKPGDTVTVTFAKYSDNYSTKQAEVTLSGK